MRNVNHKQIILNTSPVLRLYKKKSGMRRLPSSYQLETGTAGRRKGGDAKGNWHGTRRWAYRGARIWQPNGCDVVLQNLLMCMVCFYSLYYIVVSLCIGLFRVHEINSLLTPFDYTTQPSWQNPKYLVGVISTEVTYVLGGLVFAWIVEEWVWDYAITVTLLHVGVTVAVMSDFPSAEHWWIALGSGLVMMIFGGQLLAYKLFRNNFVYPAELQNF